ncbi:transcriptional regulator, TrmB [Methanococcus vannielii SB]|uniref:Transcriptional regulator, TrmB n=1 Tax=Methanococcus vannielii (strain ATCC 35089 / DSM 1224 / JCM 13029 / OCM 148 / SB) TaxID=406327 RepID=A6USV1_METVS|nr:helix-turn-helix domain-containing protein [Methanococcus vannielii]ABR55573.1 transcriptional regulator, TrmB [Methanococcus vannielii SB]
MSPKVKIFLYMLIFIVSVVVLTSKFLYPPNIQVIVQADTTYIQEVPNVYTIYDCIIMVLSSFLLAISTTLIYFTLKELETPESKNTGNITLNDLSELNEHIGNIISLKVESEIKKGTENIENLNMEEPSKKAINNDKKELEDAEKIQKLVNILKGNEKTIITVLMNHGEMTQRELFERTKIPKSTLSRTLSDLELRGIILRYDHGISKKVKLNKL